MSDASRLPGLHSLHFGYWKAGRAGDRLSSVARHRGHPSPLPSRLNCRCAFVLSFCITPALGCVQGQWQVVARAAKWTRKERIIASTAARAPGARLSPATARRIRHRHRQPVGPWERQAGPTTPSPLHSFACTF